MDSMNMSWYDIKMLLVKDQSIKRHDIQYSTWCMDEVIDTIDNKILLVYEDYKIYEIVVWIVIGVVGSGGSVIDEVDES